MSRAQNDSQIINGYEVIERIGAGSFGLVYKVKKNSEVYVLKQIPFTTKENKDERSEAKNEAKILSQLSFKFVVKYFESFEENNNLDIVMEYCQGGDLGSYLSALKKSKKTLTENQIWKFFIQISLGLAYIHYKKILHRDLKSLNIFLTKNLDVKIGDLGVAKLLQNTLHAYTFIGTPFYLSPEILEEKPYNEKSDVWALGCILYELATFKHPYHASNQAALFLKIKNGKYEPISPLFSNDLKKMVDLLLMKDYYNRPTMKEVVQMGIFIEKAKSFGLFDDWVEIISLYKAKSFIASPNIMNMKSERKNKSKQMKLIESHNNSAITHNRITSSKNKKTRITANSSYGNINNKDNQKGPVKDYPKIVKKIYNQKSPSMIDMSFVKKGVQDRSKQSSTSNSKSKGSVRTEYNNMRHKVESSSNSNSFYNNSKRVNSQRNSNSKNFYRNSNEVSNSNQNVINETEGEEGTNVFASKGSAVKVKQNSKELKGLLPMKKETKKIVKKKISYISTPGTKKNPKLSHNNVKRTSTNYNRFSTNTDFNLKTKKLIEKCMKKPATSSTKFEVSEFIEELKLNKNEKKAEKSHQRNANKMAYDDAMHFVVESNNQRQKNVLNTSVSEGSLTIDDRESSMTPSSRDEEEKVSVVKSDFDIDKSIQELEKENKELVSLQKKYQEKYNTYKSSLLEYSTKIDVEKLLDMCQGIKQNENIDEITKTIGSYIEKNLKEERAQFNKLFYNYIFYEMELKNINKEIENRKKK